VAPPVFKTGLAGIAFAGGFDSLPSPPKKPDRKPGTAPNSHQTGCLVVKAISIAVKDGASQPVVRLAEFLVVLAGRDEPQA
jgi:hypothetical protein